jgi:hypothetical protein
MPLAHPELPREVGDRATIERTGGDAARRGAGEARDGVAGSAARRQLRAAAQARPVARPLGRCRGGEEATPLRIRHAGGTDGAAIDPRRRDADEEHAVESRVARVERPRIDLVDRGVDLEIVAHERT